MLLLLTNNAAGLHVQVVQTEGIGAHADHCSEKGACAEDWTPASDCSGSVVVQTQVLSVQGCLMLVSASVYLTHTQTNRYTHTLLANLLWSTLKRLHAHFL